MELGSLIKMVVVCQKVNAAHGTLLVTQYENRTKPKLQICYVSTIFLEFCNSCVKTPYNSFFFPISENFPICLNLVAFIEGINFVSCCYRDQLCRCLDV